LQRRDTIANVQAAEKDGITATQAGVEQNIEPHPLLRPDRPARLVTFNLLLLLTPLLKARPLLSLWILDASRRIAGDVLGLERPPE